MNAETVILLSAVVSCVVFCACAVVYTVERMHTFYTREMKAKDTILARQHRLIEDMQDKLVSKDFTAYSAISSIRSENERQRLQGLNGAEKPAPVEGDVFEEFEEAGLGPGNFGT